MRKSPFILGCAVVCALATAAGAVDVASEMDITQKVLPGQTLQGEIALQSNTGKDETVKLYQTDYVFAADGKTSYPAPGTVPRSNAKWFSLVRDRVVVPAGEKIEVAYSGRVPDDANLKGSYWSMIMVEPVSPLSPENPANRSAKAPHVGITETMRYGIQVVTTIGAGSANIKILQKRLAHDVETSDGKERKKIARELQVDIQNTGDLWLRPFVTLDLFNTKGAKAGPFAPVMRKRIYPGCSARFEIDLSTVAAGSYKAFLLVDNKDSNVFGSQFPLEIK